MLTGDRPQETEDVTKSSMISDFDPHGIKNRGCFWRNSIVKTGSIYSVARPDIEHDENLRVRRWYSTSKKDKNDGVSASDRRHLLLWGVFKGNTNQNFRATLNYFAIEETRLRL